MRERLTLAFVGLTLALLVLVGVVRGVWLSHSVREDELDTLGEHATQVAIVFDRRFDSGLPVSSLQLQDLTDTDTRLTVSHPNSPDLTATGDQFRDDDVRGEQLLVRRTVGETTVVALQSDAHVRASTQDLVVSLVGIMLVAVLLAIGFGLVIARRLSEPFAALARNAEALGRGRFDIDLPDSNIPEVVALGAALKTSAQNLEHEFQRNREYAELASHALRTPITALRLELDELLVGRDLDDDTRLALTRCLAGVMRLQDTIGELVDAGRGRGLLGRTTVPLHDLARALERRWSQRLPDTCEVRTRVEQGGDLTVLPGPVEQVLDSVLADVCAHGTGPVTVRLEAEESHVRISVTARPQKTPPSERPDADRGASITEVLGGRWEGDALAGGLDILLPRR
ncbi:signal transduction histidine kinase [Nocardioides sp. BE266]|uniref:sensor histidine kinase n=1 Tax=Nocardioides sp. BE266 TaxID=2817725 RepID=UPI0028555650|nr:HAMP domain-containing sensor histidine kinase [Nocardioides sp. BE266]MDR7252690.1 signal transduction histidine kinase [Nocardioides sp. BE266]